MCPEKTCISCNSTRLVLTGGVLECVECTLRMAADMHTLDYESSYNEDASLYGEHIKSLNRFQSSTVPLHRLLPFEYRIIELLQQASNVQSLVDLGCGTGRFLRAAENIGLNAAGFEVASILVNELRRHGRHVEKGGIDEFIASDSQADAVTLLEVVEHLSNPGAAIASILNRKSPRMLFVVVPDWAKRRRFDSRFAAHDVPPNHLTWWNRESLAKLLDHQGYEVRVEEVAEIRRSLLGHIFRNRSAPSPASIVDWAHALAVPPAFWLLGTAYQR
jgi:SAM-dependent methyltransferase